MNTTTYKQLRAEVLQNRFGLRIASHLAGAAAELPHDISERLRAAREQAVSQRRRAATTVRLRRATEVSGSGASATLSFGDEGLGFWGRLASIGLVLALAIGLVTINVLQDDDRAMEIADLDSALLTDDLPPEAYADPGFLRYLKVGSDSGTTSR